MKTLTIEICERANDYGYDSEGKPTPKFRAYLKNKRAIWGRGNSRAEAIEDLRTAHPHHFRPKNTIKYTHLGKCSR